MTDPDDLLAGELRGMLGHVDPVPSLVTAMAKASLGWRRLDAELAELLSDSALSDGGAVLTRGPGDDRSLTFAAGELTIEIEVLTDGLERRILGQLSTGGPATVTMQRAEQEPGPVAEADRLGRFRLSVPHTGRVRLRVERRPSAPVETSWFSI